MYIQKIEAEKVATFTLIASILVLIVFVLVFTYLSGRNSGSKIKEEDKINIKEESFSKTFMKLKELQEICRRKNAEIVFFSHEYPTSDYAKFGALVSGRYGSEAKLSGAYCYKDIDK